MPLTEFQRSVLRLLHAHRNPNSYVAGGAAIHRAQGSLRHSRDIDFFHDTDEAVAACSQADLTLLNGKGYQAEMLISQPSIVRAIISRNAQTLKLEWVRDSAFRFFPVEEDDDLGYRLHDVDLAVNKCLALANRNEVRDILDLVQLDQDVISLPAACWAACGKDPGFTPELLLDFMRRHSIIRPEQLAAESLTRPLSPVQLKSDWLKMLDAAAQELKKYPADELGCVYVTAAGEAIRSPGQPAVGHKRPHFGSVGGAWPQIVE